MATAEESGAVGVVANYFLDKPPCCLAFSPIDPSLLVVGTYNLLSTDEVTDAHADESSHTASDAAIARRDGSLALLSVNDHEITHIQTIDNHEGGVLDLKIDGHDIYTATSVGTIDLYELQPRAQGSQASLRPRRKIQVAGCTTVITSLAINTFPDGPKQIAFTASDGQIGLLSIPCDLFDQADSSPSAQTTTQENTILDMTTQVEFLQQQHTLEAWIVAFSPPSWTPRTILSGGDDAALISHVEDSAGGSTVGFRDRRTHGAGVTALLPLELFGELSDERLLLTGSYDDRLRVLDLGSGVVASLRLPTVVGELDLGGGVWRMKILRLTQDGLEGADMVRLTLAVACMYAGAFVVGVGLRREDDAAWVSAFQILHHMKEHGSICYGIDAKPSCSGSLHDAMSCSFYDRRLCLWQWPPVSEQQ